MSALRAAEAPDHAAMAQLALHAQVQGWDAAALAQTLAPPLGRGWVRVGEGGRLEGFLLARVVADEAELLLIVVAPPARRRGLGRALWAAFEASLRADGVARVFLEVAHDNAAALALYRGLDFEEAGRRPGYYRSGADAVLMRRDL